MPAKLVLVSTLLLVVGLLGACGSAPAAPTTVPPGSAALVVQGKVGQELHLSLDDLKALGVQKLTAEHPKKGPQEYEGVLLSAVLDKAGLASDATTAVLTASDGFSAEVAVADAKACSNCLVAIEGSTLSMVMPGMPSKSWVKSVTTIEIK